MSNESNHNDGSNANGSGDGETVAELKKRIAELEAALAKMTQQREETRRMLFEIHSIAFPDNPPPTEEELLEERKTIVELSISQIIAELETESGVQNQ